MKDLTSWKNVVSEVLTSSPTSPSLPFLSSAKAQILCKFCNREFEGSKRFKFCSHDCFVRHTNKLSAQRSERQKQKRKIGYASGMLFGKPLWEVILNRYKASAKKKDVPFELSPDDFLSFWQKSCTYCGEKIETIGLDRVDSDLGYTLGNIVPCCTQCNMSKRHQKPEDYIARCIKIARKCGNYLPQNQ